MPQGERRFTLARIDVAAVLAMTVLAFLLVGLHVDGYNKISPVDELQHIDYLYQIPDHPEPTDKVGQEALHQQACRGLDAAGWPPPGCQTGELDPEAFQEKGYNTAAGYAPVYYALTRAVAEVIEPVTPANDLVTAGRLAGGLWLALGLALIYAAGRLRGIGRGPLLAVCVLICGSPAVLFPSSTVAPDAIALALGGAIMLALSWWEQAPSVKRALLVILLGVIASLAKTTYLAVVAAVALYLLIRWARGTRRSEVPSPARGRGVVVGLVASVASLAAVAAWSAYFASLPQIAEADLPDMAVRFRVETFSWLGLGESLLSMVQPLSFWWVIVGTPQLVYIATGAASLLLTAGVIASGVLGNGPEKERDLARSTLVAAIVCAAGLVVMGYFTAGVYVPVAPRYGMALVPAIALCTAAGVRTRGSLGIIAAIAATVVGLSLVRLVALP